MKNCKLFTGQLRLICDLDDKLLAKGEATSGWELIAEVFFVIFDTFGGGIRLSLLLAMSGTSTTNMTCDYYINREDTIMVWAFLFDHVILRGSAIGLLSEFLQITLRVTPRFVDDNFVHFSQNMLVNELFSAQIALVKIDRPGHRLKTVGNNRGMSTITAEFFAFLETNEMEIADFGRGAAN